jgi:formate dehydrogenase major subunit
MNRLSIDGVSVQVADAASVLTAARRAGFDLPGLCYDPRLSPQGSCRVCLVSVEGGPTTHAQRAPPAWPWN